MICRDFTLHVDWTTQAYGRLIFYFPSAYAFRIYWLSKTRHAFKSQHCQKDPFYLKYVRAALTFRMH